MQGAPCLQKKLMGCGANRDGTLILSPNPIKLGDTNPLKPKILKTKTKTLDNFGVISHKDQAE
jgi:hypothetical protein